MIGHKGKKYKPDAVILFNSGKKYTLKSIIHYLKNVCKLVKSHLALTNAIFPMFNINIKSKKDLRQL